MAYHHLSRFFVIGVSIVLYYHTWEKLGEEGNLVNSETFTSFLLTNYFGFRSIEDYFINV